MQRVLFTHHIPEIAEVTLQKNTIETVVMKKKNPTTAHILQEVHRQPYDGLVTLLTDSIDEKCIRELPDSIKIIANYAVGFNNIKLEAAKKRNIVVTNTPGVLTDTVAEHTLAMMLAVSTRTVEADTFVRKNKFTGWEPELLLGLDLKGKKVGVIGAGRIGARFAELAKGIGMSVLYYDIAENKELEEKVDAVFCASPEEVFRTADVISLHIPLNTHTHHFVNARKIGMMKNTAIILNASRGPVVDEEALTVALKNGNIFGAALDVFEHEPKVSSKLRSLKNVVLSPHTASASIGTRNAMAQIVANNVVAALQGGVAPNAL